MKKEIPFRYKLRYVCLFGKIKQIGTMWQFTPDPIKQCSCLFMEHKSKWVVVETVYDIIKSYN